MHLGKVSILINYLTFARKLVNNFSYFSVRGKDRRGKGALS